MSKNKNKYIVQVAVLYENFTWKEHVANVEAYHDDAAVEEALDRIEYIADRTLGNINGICALHVSKGLP